MTQLFVLQAVSSIKQNLRANVQKSKQHIQLYGHCILIYDLDETLMPDSILPDAVFIPLKEALTAANKGTLSASKLENAFGELKSTAIDLLAQKYGFSEEMQEVAKKVSLESEYPFKLVPFGDYELIREIPGKRILVTSGVVKLQQAKIDALGIAGDFDEVIVDDLYQENRPGKKDIFAGIAQKYKAKPEQVWIIGDNPDAEIKAGNELGMVTVHRVNCGKTAAGEATHSISTFHDLKKILAAQR